MLSVVDAIARQTATINPEDFVARFSKRIQALSASQDLLVRNEWNGIEIEDLVRARWRPSPISLVLVSLCTAPSCA
jgi:two-component sensor histidine kinase